MPLSFEQYEYRIASHYLPALINGDESCLTDAESDMLNAFLSSLQPGHGHWGYADDSSFGKCEVSDIYADIVICQYFVPVFSPL